MADNKDKKVLNVPALRFPEFTEEWEKVRLGDNCNIQMCKRIMAAQTNTEGGVPFYKIGTIGSKADAYISKDLFDEYKMKYSFPHKGEVMITCAGTVGKCIIYNGEDSYYQDSNIVWIDNPDKIILNDFLYHLLSRINWSRLNSTTIVRIYNDDLRNLKLYCPRHDEQKKITKFLSLIDKRIETQNKIIEKLETLIKGIRHNIFKQLRKNVGFNATIGNILSFEQPQRYIVSSAEYSNDCTFTPVLTANKAFILGYTTETDGIYSKGDCIIIDDFTLDCKYVSFPFKVKSSAIKILTAKNKFILRYTYEYLKSLELSTEEHKRHYIAEVQPHSCVLPDENTLKTIALVFENLACKLADEQSLVLILNKQKQYLLSKMFI